MRAPDRKLTLLLRESRRIEHSYAVTSSVEGRSWGAAPDVPLMLDTFLPGGSLLLVGASTFLGGDHPFALAVATVPLARFPPRRYRDALEPAMKIALTAGMLVLSNVFMTFAWYGHLKHLQSRPWFVAALAAWGVALFEYLLQVPANRIGYRVLDLGQLKILQEVVTLTVFVPFAVFYMGQPLKLDYLWAGLCLLGAVYFLFRS